jgi:hypothetical protein
MSFSSAVVDALERKNEALQGLEVSQRAHERAEAAMRSAVVVMKAAGARAQQATLDYNVTLASSPDASTAQRFHGDGLGCIFSFVSLRELPSVLCCRSG